MEGIGEPRPLDLEGVFGPAEPAETRKIKVKCYSCGGVNLMPYDNYGEDFECMGCGRWLRIRGPVIEGRDVK